MSDHSIISPSTAHRWMICSASAMLSRLCPKREAGDAAQRGTLMHKAAETGDFSELTDEETVMVKEYLSFLPNSEDVLWIKTESRTGMLTPPVHPLHFGTIDSAWMTRTRILHVLDFKSGKIEVSPVSNPQLIGYVSEEVFKLDKPIEGIRLGIFQPKVSKKPQWWCLSYEQFLPYYNMYRSGAHKCFDAPEFVQGTHCKFCPAEGSICNALRSAHNPSAKDW